MYNKTISTSNSRALTPITTPTRNQSLAGSVNSNLSPITDSPQSGIEIPPIEKYGQIPTLALLPAPDSPDSGSNEKKPGVIVPSFPPTRVSSPKASAATAMHPHEPSDLPDTLQRRLLQDEATNEESSIQALEKGQVEVQPENQEIGREISLIDFDVSNTGSDVHDSGNDHHPSEDGQITQLNSPPLGHSPDLSSQAPLDDKLPEGGLTSERKPSTKTSDREYQAGIEGYLAHEDATARTGNVNKKARVRTKKSTRRDLREAGRLKGSMRNSEIGDIINPIGEQDETGHFQDARKGVWNEQDVVGEDIQRMRDGGDPHEYSRYRPGVDSTGNLTGQHMPRTSGPHQPYIYPEVPAIQHPSKTTEGPYIGRDRVVPQQWPQHQQYLYGTGYFYPALPGPAIESYSGHNTTPKTLQYSELPALPTIPRQAYTQYAYPPQYIQRTYLSEGHNGPPVLTPQYPHYPVVPVPGPPSSGRPVPGPLFPMPMTSLRRDSAGIETLDHGSSKQEVTLPPNPSIQVLGGVRDNEGRVCTMEAIHWQPSSSSQTKPSHEDSAIPHGIPERLSSKITSNKLSLDKNQSRNSHSAGEYSGSQSRGCERDRRTRKSKDKSHGHSSHTRNRTKEDCHSEMDISEYKQTLHVTSDDFEKIITDLEDMLTQALELAGRAVEGGALANGLGYSLSTRKDGGRPPKRSSSKTEGKFHKGEEELTRYPSIGARVGKSARERQDSLPTLYSEDMAESSKERLSTTKTVTCEAVGNENASTGSQGCLKSVQCLKTHRKSMNENITQKAVKLQSQEPGSSFDAADTSREGRAIESLSLREALDTGPALTPGIISTAKPKSETLPEDGGYHEFLKQLALEKVPKRPRNVPTNGSDDTENLEGDRIEIREDHNMSPPPRAPEAVAGCSRAWSDLKKRCTSFIIILVLALEWGLVGA